MKKSGKCTRCGRSLKTVFLVAGAEYGSVCVKKIGGTTAAELGTRSPRSHKDRPPSDQLTFEESDVTVYQRN
jgi:hypothetical protein